MAAAFHCPKAPTDNMMSDLTYRLYRLNTVMAVATDSNRLLSMNYVKITHKTILSFFHYKKFTIIIVHIISLYR